MTNRDLDNLTTLARRASDRAEAYRACGVKPLASHWRSAANALQAAHEALILAMTEEKNT